MSQRFTTLLSWIFNSVTTKLRLYRYFRAILICGLLLLVDTYLSVLVARRIGVYAMLAAHTGISLFSYLTLRSSILSQLQQLEREMQLGIPNYTRFAQVIHYSVGALLLFTPGFVSSALGFILFIPPFRYLFLRILKTHARSAMHNTYNQLRGTTQSSKDFPD